eukprot:Protomagalhaensia_wolfi_Nauph_80__3094@NODE_3165_length_867_cov_3_463768_g2480_i0_p1_GENE_NODE_3165_length_867_cov_3_463768_g2480_i0NODE_3165_length_867_cov_3_463768_g2480_i0_p1_ORF_typecomplete_len209_score22_48_NODE_3165_length_867_cov_3_463768_g2480_i0221847
MCGWLFLLVTLYVALFVSESFQDNLIASSSEVAPMTTTEVGSNSGDGDTMDIETPERDSICSSYLLLLRMVRMAPVQLACVFLLTARIPFGAIDGAIHLKMLETGIRKEEIAMLSPLVVPWGVASSYTAGKVINKQWSALAAFKKGYIFRLSMILVWTAVFLLSRDVYNPLVKDSDSRGAKKAICLIPPDHSIRVHVCLSNCFLRPSF